jgi:MOSC domain-containing protein YiiM
MSPVGHVFQINSSDGGVPKLARRSDQVGEQGLATDRQRYTKVHGGPDRAVCLYSLERILALQAEGHPIYPGAAGENLTLAGLNWDAVRPGLKLALGESLQLEVVSYTVPCKTIAGAFADGDSQRISQDRHPGWSRVYTRVLAGGEIRVGDGVRVLGLASNLS